MKTQKLEISGIPALMYGKESRKVYLYVHVLQDKAGSNVLLCETKQEGTNHD